MLVQIVKCVNEKIITSDDNVQKSIKRKKMRNKNKIFVKFQTKFMKELYIQCNVGTDEKAL